MPHGGVPGAEAWGRPTRVRGARRARGERDGLGVPWSLPRRALEAPLPAYAGRGRRPKAWGPSVTPWRPSRSPHVWRRLTGRDGAQGPVDIEMVTRRVQTRGARTRRGPAAWRVVTRRPRAAPHTLEPKAAPDATEQDTRAHSPYALTPTGEAAGVFQEPSRGELARVLQAGAGIAASVPRGQGAVGMDEDQGRPGQGGQHHLALSLMAGWCLLGETHRGPKVPPALPLPPGRYGLSLLLLERYGPPGIDDICRPVQRQWLRHASARFDHHGTRKGIPPRTLRQEIQ